MGGLGSGSYVRLGPRHARVEDLRSFDLTMLRRHKCLTGKPRVWHWTSKHGRPAIDIGIVADVWGVRFLWKRNNEWRENRITYGTSGLSFGSRRWFCCPTCQNNCRVLYWSDPAAMACRKCWGLRYASQSMEPQWRADRKADAIRRRLGATDRTRDEFPPKPPKMRWATYERLLTQHAVLIERWALGMQAAFGTMERRAAKTMARLHHHSSD